MWNLNTYNNNTFKFPPGTYVKNVDDELFACDICGKRISQIDIETGTDQLNQCYTNAMFIQITLCNLRWITGC